MRLARPARTARETARAPAVALAVAVAVAVAVPLGGCGGTPIAGLPGPAATAPPPGPPAAAEARYKDPVAHGVPPHAHTLPAAPGPTLRDAREATVLPGAAGARVWAGEVSPEFTFDQAARYCAGLPPWRGRAFRVPTLDELGDAPRERFAFGEGARLWSATPVPDHPDLRWSLDPGDGRLDPKHPAQGIGLRVLCVSDARR